jgi:hypothetical protein
MPSSGPDDDGAWLQVGAAALKHCVASGTHPEATLLFGRCKLGTVPQHLRHIVADGSGAAEPILLELDPHHIRHAITIGVKANELLVLVNADGR